MTNDDDKRCAAEAAVAEVRPGMLVGLGTGSTAHHAIMAIGRLVAGGMRIEAVVTSEASGALARRLGIPVRDFAGVARVDLTIDGADEIDDACRAIKGAGGAMLREKIVARASDRMVVIADGTKRVAALGAMPVPVEVLPFARAAVLDALERIGATVTLRDGYYSDNGNLVADCRFPSMPDAAVLARSIDAVPGALGHGLFLDEVDAAYICADGRVTMLGRGA